MSEAENLSAKARHIGDTAQSPLLKVQERVAVLYEVHREAIYRFLIKYGLNPATAQELTQEAFLRMLIALSRGDVIQSEKAWLFGVAAKIAVDHWRREGQPMWVELEAVPSATRSLQSKGPTPEETAIEYQRNKRVAKRLDRLPKAQRLGIELRMRGLHYRAIAAVLGVSLSTASELLSNAVECLRIAANC